MAYLMTVRGPLDAAQAGLILPHEHLFVDWRPADTPGYAQADIADVRRRLDPDLRELKELGVSTLVECTPPIIGRNVEILRALSEAHDLHIIAAAGAYRDPLVPSPLREQRVAALADWMMGELQQGVGETGIRCGFIKLGASDEGLTALEERFLRAAARASQRTGAVIASHTLAGTVALRQMDILAEEGLDLGRFVWVHAHVEPDLGLHREAAARGAWLEYDGIGDPNTPDAIFVNLVQHALAQGFGRQVMLSQDAGWYTAGEPEADMRTLGYLVRTFLPALQQAGVSDADIRMLTADNPARAFAMEA
ncbi:MAG: phosphotriesterase family protein [Anaerolineae bacterium]